MSGLENLNTRLNYRGGTKPQERLISGKLNALKKSNIKFLSSCYRNFRRW